MSHQIAYDYKFFLFHNNLSFIVLDLFLACSNLFKLIIYCKSFDTFWTQLACHTLTFIFKAKFGRMLFAAANSITVQQTIANKGALNIRTNKYIGNFKFLIYFRFQ